MTASHNPPLGGDLRDEKVRRRGRDGGIKDNVRRRENGLSSEARAAPDPSPGRRGEEMGEAILEDEEVDVLREIANIGSGHAAASMETWLGRDMVLEAPQAFMLPVEEVAEHIGDPLETVICVYSRMNGDLSGHLLYILGLEDARVLLDLLLDPEDKKWGFSPHNLSAIAETGNILFNAYLTAVSRVCDLELYPGTPSCAADMLEAVVNTVLLEICEGSDNTLVLETCFRGEGLSSVGYVLFLAENEDLRTLVRRAEEQ